MRKSANTTPGHFQFSARVEVFLYPVLYLSECLLLDVTRHRSSRGKIATERPTWAKQCPHK
jgi:hypothetical protein